MTPANLSRAGELLYGPQWQSAFARALSVTPRSMRRWAREGCPDRVDHEIGILLVGRMEDIRAFYESMARPVKENS